MKGNVFQRQHFDAVVTVLGTNNIPKVTARQAMWDRLEDAGNNVAKVLKDYLVKASLDLRGAKSKHPSTSGVPVYITEPFCCKGDKNVVLFKEVLQKVCTAEGFIFLGF